ncbi:MAG: efflux RND transporter periplasmic adaptor subunit [Acidobacteriaceae bacterium]|nr:efflux RND transporter periplasmic adaptor subunit [Acidobacteriaceae bacterium]
MGITRWFQLDGPCKPQNTQARSRWHKPTWALLLGGTWIFAAISGCQKKEASPPPAPPDVRVAEVVQQNVPIFNEWVAQLNGPVNADITPKVQGYLLRQDYQNGFFVKKGQLLFELDPRQYEADVEEAKAGLAVAQAELARYQNDVTRDTPLAAQNAIPQKTLDNDIASRDASAAAVKANQAKLDNAQLNLAWTKVYSPIDGIAGVSNSQVGDLVGMTTKMATVSQVNPIWAYFNVSESQFLGVATRVTGIISGKSSEFGRTPVEFIQANDVPYPQKGRFIYVNREVGTQTGTIQIAAEFPNPQAVLRPGGYGRVRVQTGNNEDALLVPQPAVIEVQSNYMMIVLGPDNKAHFRPVKMGPRIGPNWIVTEGVKPGEKVVVEGIERLQMAAAAMPQLAKEGIPVSAQPYLPAATAGPAGGGN